MELPSQIAQIGTMAERLLSAWTQDSRLHTLATPPGAAAATDASAGSAAYAIPRVRASDLLLERFELHEAVSEPFCLSLQVLMLDAHVPLKQLCGLALTLRTQLADGSHVLRSGIVTEARALHADGGFARKALTVQPWIALLAHTLNSRVWQDRSVIDIVDDVFSRHPELAVWRWDEGVADHVAQGLFARNGGQRAYCVQHRESDLDFVQRLLAEEGIAWRVEEITDASADANANAPAGHGIVLFVHSQAQPQDLTSASGFSAGTGTGIRFHASPGQDSQESQDSIHALAHERRLGPTAHTVLGWDHKAHAAISAEVVSQPDWGPAKDEGVAQLTPWLGQYDPTSGYLFGTPDEARFAATLLQQAEEVRTQRWLGRGNVRTLRAGTWAAVSLATQSGEALLGALQGLAARATDATTDASAGPPDLFVTRLHAVGVNTLPKGLRHDLAAPAAHDTSERAASTGYACSFEAVPRNTPWRPALQDGTGLRLRPRPTARGPQTAIVVGPDGSTQPQGADELHTDAMGRVRVRFHWQSAVLDRAAESEAESGAEARDSCWLRVQQRLAGTGMGHQFIPRIGQEVLVGFLGNDIDRPLVIASLYNGQGESGLAPTPAGGDGSHAGEAPSVSSALAQSSDHTPASQMNLIGEGPGGHSPAWHGAAPGAATEGNAGQANAAALSGIKSKEFGGSGHNQLVLDDTPQQLRARLHTTQAQTWLEMGHLLHQADNHRGSLRGQGLELRTDAWGGLRAARGVLLSTYGLRPAGPLTPTAEPAGDNAAGIALARQMQQLTEAFHQAAGTHQTVGLASGVQASSALSQSLRGSVSAHRLNEAVQDAQARNTSGTSPASSGRTAVPHLTDPHIALVGRAGVGLSAGQDVHLSSQGATTLASGQDSHWAVGGQARIHTGQAIGVLAGAMQPGGADAAGNASGQAAAGKGLTLIAAQGPIELQAQSGPAQVAAQQVLELKTAQGMVNIAAAKRVVLATNGGAGITLEGGQLTVQCPGKITVRAGQKSMVGPSTLAQAMNAMPGGLSFNDAYVVRNPSTGEPLPNVMLEITRGDGSKVRTRTDAAGKTPMQKSVLLEAVSLRVLD